MYLGMRTSQIDQAEQSRNSAAFFCPHRRLLEATSNQSCRTQVVWDPHARWQLPASQPLCTFSCSSLGPLPHKNVGGVQMHWCPREAKEHRYGRNGPCRNICRSRRSSNDQRSDRHPSAEGWPRALAELCLLRARQAQKVELDAALRRLSSTPTGAHIAQQLHPFIQTTSPAPDLPGLQGSEGHHSPVD
jgi:hypothetical protein